MRVVCWFSCGATSAVAAKIALERYKDAVLAYCDTNSEHDDNKRFMSDCEDWLGKPVVVLQSEKYKDIWDVFERAKYLVGVHGAMCTGELKKKVRMKFQRPDDLQIFGFDKTEKERAKRFNDNNPDVHTWFPLIENGLTKEDCLQELMKAKIELPAMYKLGYRNNNCIGCVKGQQGYWNKIRKDFPDVFSRMSKIERTLDVAINKSYANDGKRKRVFLDELDPLAGKHKDLEISCGLFCGEY
jgi:3'-phosphoadenosine 5'-phosphosulfate sulfotransferase (PAPS reductase)/FAD synthetase